MNILLIFPPNFYSEILSTYSHLDLGTDFESCVVEPHLYSTKSFFSNIYINIFPKKRL